MSEDQAVTARQGTPNDAARIDLGAAAEVRYWTRELGVSEDILREAVDHAGPEVEAVRHYLGSGS
ncbi:MULTISPECIES: DUF3606 domain-containing protein [unclassified Caulobacter]|uniref:DUF3606 domain-containing protein n=1 Tax=unclassified Caulobacter TaxID=2648921 RepID=UPI0006FA3FA1|nr:MULTISPECIES: DUF3606 domain-containing protein [unclassified Caulobacter]KQV55782.1 hypothetical protein ASC62_17795 [Caulobacter sp. Root342]KQV71045.1 hypothetical protein ASC70_05460 [Caulobacter sp. Root343]